MLVMLSRDRATGKVNAEINRMWSDALAPTEMGLFSREAHSLEKKQILEGRGTSTSIPHWHLLFLVDIHVLYFEQATASRCDD